MTTHAFDEKLARGESGEDVVDSYFSAWFDIERADRSGQREGWDRLYTNRRTGQRWRVEIKTDEKSAETGNVFLETVSVFKDNRTEKLGWVYSSQADKFLIWLPGHHQIFVFNPHELVVLVDEWRDIFREHRIPNDGYDTFGIAVPMMFVARRARIVEVPF